MKPSYSQGRYNRLAHKNATPMMDYSDEDMSNGEAFINSDASQRFIDYFSRMSMHLERGFILDMRDENLGLPGDMKWIKFCQ